VKKPPRKRAARRKPKVAPDPPPAPLDPAPAPPAPSSSLPVPAARPSIESVPRDALARYFAEVGRYPLLSREEELELAERVHESNDPEAAQKLVLSNLRLVVKIALEYRRVWTNLLDLIQEGTWACCRACAASTRRAA
jgi:DNA-directed RNA polymerase sigma subunit (sigma70/sigma32)